MSIEADCLAMASLGSTAYELLLLKDVWQKQFVAGTGYSQLRTPYLILVLIWVPVCASVACIVFGQEMELKKMVLVGFGLPAALKTLSSRLFTEAGGRQLGATDARKVFRVFFQLEGSQ